MDSQSSNASEVPDEITCYQDEQFVEEITSVNDIYFANKNQFAPLLTSPNDDSDRDEISDGHDDSTDTGCDIPLEHRTGQWMYPHHAQEVGPLFFKTPRNYQCFGRYVQTEQVNFIHCNDHNYVYSNI